MQAAHSLVTKTLLSSNKTYNYNVKLCNIWVCGKANKTSTWIAILPVYEQQRSKLWIDDTQLYVLIKSISVIQDDVRVIL